MHESAERIAAQMHGQCLLTVEDEWEVYVLLIPRSLWQPLAALDDSSFETAIERWGSAVASVERPGKSCGFFARLFGALRNEASPEQWPESARRETLMKMCELATDAVARQRELFLMIGA